MNDGSALTAAAPQSAALTMTLRRAAACAQARSHRYVTLEHLLLALTDDQDAVAVLRSVNADVDHLKARATDVVNRFLTALYAPGSAEIRPSYKLDRILQTAAADAAKSPYSVADGAFVIAALTAEADSVAAGLLRQYGLGFNQAMGWIYANRSNAKRERREPTPARAPSHGGLEDMLAATRASADDQAGARRAEPREFRLSEFAPRRPEPERDGRMEPSQRLPHDRTRKPTARSDKSLSAALGAVQAEPAPRPEPPIANSPAPGAGRALVVAKSGGKLADAIPRRMKKGAPVQIDIRMSREEAAALFNTLQGPQAPDAHDVIITKAMTVLLRAPDGGFIIETQARETQWIFDRPSFLDSERFGRWRWTATPTASGKKRLQIIAYLRAIDDNGIAGDMVTPDQIVEVRVGGGAGRAFRKMMLWVFLIVFGGVATETALFFGPFLFR
ncbi:MAG: Clp protease N-terminal domain-containing protein [Hyphomicrobiales bacterium]|nr:Clp protease N-terminal domain-containing protein [Hyphomicrobiales bacterium]